MVFHRGVKTGSRGDPRSLFLPPVSGPALATRGLSLVDAPAITVVPRGDAELKGTGSWPSLHPFRRLADTFPEMAEPKIKPGHRGTGLYKGLASAGW